MKIEHCFLFQAHPNVNYLSSVIIKKRLNYWLIRNYDSQNRAAGPKQTLAKKTKMTVFTGIVPLTKDN